MSDDYAYTSSGARRPLTVKGNFAFFWGQWPSNWERASFVIDDVKYNCVEQWMMAEKARVHNDAETAERIMQSDQPAEQKKLGRAIRNYDEEKWKNVRYDIVLRGTLEKYRQNPELRELLLATHDLCLVEASPEDRIWGIGMRSNDPNILDVSRWGQNLLGKVLMDARKILREEFNRQV